LVSGVIGTLLQLQFWTFTGRYFTVTQGKRLFGPLAAFGILGATLGAAAASAIVRHLPPFAMWPAFPTSDYYEGSVAMGLAPCRRSHVL
jgi:hypothetical protein